MVGWFLLGWLIVLTSTLGWQVVLTSTLTDQASRAAQMLGTKPIGDSATDNVTQIFTQLASMISNPQIFI